MMGGDIFISIKILKEPMLVQKQIVPYIKAPILSFCDYEPGQGRGITMGVPRPFPVKRSINMMEIKVSPPMPNRVIRKDATQFFSGGPY